MDLIRYVKALPVREFSEGELLFASSEPSDTVLAIREGFVKATTTDESGRQRLLWIAGRYDLVPLERFFSRRVLQYDYVGYTSGSAYIIEKAKLHGFIKESPNVATEVAKGMSEHFDDISERMSAIGKADIKSKLLHTLYSLSIKFSSVDVVKLHEIGLNLTHQDLADMIGASREVVSIELNKCRRDGYIDYSRSTFIVNTEKIRQLLGIVA